MVLKICVQKLGFSSNNQRIICTFTNYSDKSTKTGQKNKQYSKPKIMRNLFTASVFALLFIGLPANAQKRSLAEAAKVATVFFHAEEVDAMQMKEEEGSRRLQKKVMDYTSDAYYMFRNKEDNRLVVISGDQRMQSILGYTDNAIEDNMMPDGLAELLTTYKRQYAALSPD